MGIFNRLSAFIKIKLNDEINKAEAPQKRLEQLIIEMDQELVEAKKQLAIAIADQKRLEELEQDQATIEKLKIQQELVNNLKNALGMLNNKIDEAKRKRQLLIARNMRTNNPPRIRPLPEGLSLRDTEAFDAFCERVSQREAEEEALEKKFEAEIPEGADAALEALKERPGLSPQPPVDTNKKDREP